MRRHPENTAILGLGLEGGASHNSNMSCVKRVFSFCFLVTVSFRWGQRAEEADESGIYAHPRWPR